MRIRGVVVLLIKLWNYLSGYVIIKINGEYGERLLNQAALKIFFYGMFEGLMMTI